MEAVDLMTEKEIRLRTLAEEADLLYKTAHSEDSWERRTGASCLRKVARRIAPVKWKWKQNKDETVMDNPMASECPSVE